MPEDLMGTILSESSGAAGGLGDTDLPGGSQPPGEGVSWQQHPERVGVAFNLSKQLTAELDRIRLETGGDQRPSRSELVEAALRLAVEDVRRNGSESELLKRLSERPATPVAAPTENSESSAIRVERGVDDSGSIVETTYNEDGEVMDESLIGNVAELPVESEYVDEEGRLVSLAKDELGNAYEQLLDEGLNVLGTRLLDDASGGTR